MGRIAGGLRLGRFQVSDQPVESPDGPVTSHLGHHVEDRWRDSSACDGQPQWVNQLSGTRNNSRLRGRIARIIHG